MKLVTHFKVWQKSKSVACGLNVNEAFHVDASDAEDVTCEACRRTVEYHETAASFAEFWGPNGRNGVTCKPL
jgi:hypothetical protein